jgi:hypothetical protein
MAYIRPLKKRCRILPAGGLGGVPQLQKSPNTGGYRGLIESISACSLLIRFEVNPTYRVPFLWLAKM